MNTAIKLIVRFALISSLGTLSSSLFAQDELLASCFITALAVDQNLEVFWADLEPCNALIEQLDELKLSDHQEISLRINRAILLTELTEYARARADLEAALMIDPESLYLHLNMGVLSMVEQDYSAAIESFSLALEIEPTTPLALFNRALAHNYSEDLISAVNDLLTLQFEYPDDYIAWVTEESVPTLFPLLPELVIQNELLQEDRTLRDALDGEAFEGQRIEPITGD